MKIRKIELALAVALVMVLLLCAFPMKTQAELSEKLTRLHIIANSDDDCDQALKILVRNSVLAQVTEKDSEITDELLQRLRSAARLTVKKQGFDYNVAVERTRMYFETRHYDGFSLPAGEYDAVRIIIGQGQGRNWWCVLFPPLCAGAAEKQLDRVAEAAGLTNDEISFIKGDGTVVVLRFKLVELLGKLTRFFEGK